MFTPPSCRQGVTYHVDSLCLLGHHDGLGLVPGGGVHNHHLLAVLVLERLDIDCETRHVSFRVYVNVIMNTEDY